jgi:hypothetical protein
LVALAFIGSGQLSAQESWRRTNNTTGEDHERRIREMRERGDYSKSYTLKPLARGGYNSENHHDPLDTMTLRPRSGQGFRIDTQ